MVTDNSTETDDMMQDPWSLGESEGQVLFLVNGKAVEAEKLLEVLNRQHWDQFRSPSDMCARYSMQACGSCERVECGDNTSPAKKRITELEEQVDGLRAKLKKQSKEKITRYVVTAVWSGYNAAQERICHRTVVRNPEPYKKIEAVQFTDGTNMTVTVRPCKSREQVKELRGYDSLFDRIIAQGLTGWILVDDVK